MAPSPRDAHRTHRTPLFLPSHLSSRNSCALPELELSDTLFVIPCSCAKADGGERGAGGGSVRDCLPLALARALDAQRKRNATAFGLDESRRRHATDRYAGHLYQAAGAETFTKLGQAGAHLHILSGGYGVVIDRERIGIYDQIFTEAWWPGHLVQRCLAAYAQAAGTGTVVGLLSAPTACAKVFRTVTWPASVSRAFLLSPESTPGAMVKTPRAQGEALSKIASNGRLPSDWRSSDGLRMVVKRTL